MVAIVNYVGVGKDVPSKGATPWHDDMQLKHRILK
jgi:hypothetical protein